MLIEAKLKNFRQHKDLTINFENGLVALRGANEKGKTTLLEAILYAMGGARTLREPLPAVVTWGEKESSLKVWLTFSVNGVIYYIVRSKSGAEISTDEKVLATGQDEVTGYVETLLGCSIKTAGQLMLANQQKLRGTLEEDGAAVKLIEQLADFQLIDRIVALVQKHLPCGTTVSVEARIATLTEQLAVPVEDDTGPFVTVVSERQSELDQAGEHYHLQKQAYDSLQEPARAAQQRIETAAARGREVQQAKTRLESAKATFASIKPVPGPEQAVIDELRRQTEDESRLVRAKAASKALHNVPEPQWEGTYDSLLAESNRLQARRAGLDGQLSETRVKIARLQGQRITGTACGLCGKDLTAVPEVVTKNNDLDAQIKVAEAFFMETREALQLVDAEAAQYQGVVNDGIRADRVFQQCAEFITLDRNFTPAAWTWIGPDITVEATGVALQLQQAVQQQQTYQRELGRQQQAQAAVEAAEQAHATAVLVEAAAKDAVGDAEEVLAQAAQATSALYEVEQAFRTADQAVKDAQRELDTAQRMYQMRLDARKGVEKQLADAKTELKGMEFNNDLVNTLRKARPSIVEELWNIVGAGVSNTFSTIRGVPSTFLRENDSFTVDGRGIKGLSGSTLDALGLAIRMVLTKTFLPNTQLLVLDEPAAACDDGREANMLGVIATGGFDQVVLVTHSDQCQAFASQVVQL